MPVRFSPRILSIVFMSCALIFSGQSSAQHSTQNPNQNSTQNSRFQNEVQSVLGSVVNTKHGKMVLRQRKDASGKMRKQIISGPGFSELQMDQDGDGTVDFLEVTRGLKTVTASSPARGRFMRLETSMLTKKGRLEAVYLLSFDGRSYNLLRSRIIPRNKLLFADGDEESFVPTQAPPKIEADAVMSVENAQSLRANFDEQAWVEEQKSVFGQELRCDDTSGEMNKLARLQREWWKVLKFSVSDQRVVMVEKLKSSAMFDDNCRKPGNAKDFAKMVEGLADVMLSGGSGQMEGSQTRGRFLGCLDRSGLGIVAARIEKSFLTAMNDPYRLSAQIVCDFKKGASGIAMPASTSTGDARQITVRMTAVDEGKAKNPDGAAYSYSNLLFHEFMHVGSFNLGNDEDEEHAIINSAQACCGDPSEFRTSGCQKLNGLVAKKSRQVEVENYISRVPDGVAPMSARLDILFGSENAKKLNLAYLDGLDNFKKGGPGAGLYPGGLLSDAEFGSCILNNGGPKAGEKKCRAQWARDIAEYTDIFFATKCRSIVVKDRAKCVQVTQAEKAEFSRAISHSVRINFSTAEPGQCTALVRRSGGFLATLLLGAEASAEDEDDCRKNLTLPEAKPPIAQTPIGNEFPPYDTSTGVGGDTAQRQQPGADQSTADRVGNSGHGNDASVGSATPGGGRTGSPIPVTRVDSSSGAGSFIENEYRRATDIVGNTSRGFDRARDALLPSAVASEDRSRSNSRSVGQLPSRLGPDENYIAFKPDVPKAPAPKIDNPFAARRAIASLIGDEPGSPKSGVTGASAQKPGAFAGGATGSADPATTGASADPAAKGALTLKPHYSTSNSTSISANGSRVSQVAQMNSVTKIAGGSSADTDALTGIFTSPYRKIETRLKSMEVVEALIRSKISVQDASGRKLGSINSIEQYRFVGFEKTLKKVDAKNQGKK